MFAKRKRQQLIMVSTGEELRAMGDPEDDDDAADNEEDEFEDNEPDPDARKEKRV